MLGLAVLVGRPPALHIERIVIGNVPRYVAPVNALGNGSDDLILVHAKQASLVRLIGGQHQTVWQENFAVPVALSGVMAFDSTDLDGIAIHSQDLSNARAWLLDRDGRTVATIGPVHGPATRGRRWEGGLIPKVVLDRGPLGRSVVCLVLSLWSPPRAILCFDPRAGRAAWSFPLGSYPLGVAACDLLGDGRQQLLVTTSSPDNGVRENGTDDDHTYVIALDDAGRRLWQTNLNGAFADAFALALPRRGREAARVVAAGQSHRGMNPEACPLALLDGRTGAVLASRTFPDGLGSLRLVDGPRARFVAGSSVGTLRLFDADLRLLATHREKEWIEPWACADLDGDGHIEIVASTPGAGLVLDDRLRVRARFDPESRGPEPDPIRLARVELGRWSLCLRSNRTLLFDVTPLPPLRDPVRAGGVLVLSLAGGVAAARVRLPRRHRHPLAATRDFLVAHAQIRHDVFDRVEVFGALTRWAQRQVDGQAVPLEMFERARDEFTTFGLPALQRFAAQAHALDVDPGRVRSVTTRLQALRTALDSVTEETQDDRALHARRVAQEMRGLSETCAVAWREVAERLRCRADLAAQDALLAKQRALAEVGVAAQFASDPGGAAAVLFDPGELRGVIGQLIENALSAMRDAPDAELKIEVRRDAADPRWVTVRIADNGSGIPAGSREAVFRPDVSSRPGGGFGLAHGRETARRWSGDLVAEEPAEGRGAVLCLRLRALFPFEDAHSRAAAPHREGTS